ncbi:YbhB/YbcL family Raf kinase inhibitor-like protein [Corynebacterium sp.]|uniref:YbhB/YbcL family Raf kinase inhibitor-like protein n=1 Tax=Corynebacterium sp. TaxID=1720 RepID=UPI002A9202C7|nr:YbhB/YbcL family Raf kinase inhibitor-like protein [Corynebacterium sp.]MDY5784544.1 YbhB/YbcL family Raf kinase inhibitor-like protein [Corynebacterium sp.]
MTNYDYSADVFPGHDPFAVMKQVPAFTLTSTDVADGAELSAEQVGENATSPQLAWSGVPDGTKSFAVTCFDPDAPTGAGFWHWAAFNIPAGTPELPAGAGAEEDLGVGAATLAGDSGQRAFYGANPPAGHAPHRYLFAVHALDVETLDVPEDATPTVLAFNLYFHTLGRGVVWGWYENK